MCFSPIQRPLDLADMATHPIGDNTCLKHDVSKTHLTGVVRDTEPNGDEAQFAVTLG